MGAFRDFFKSLWDDYIKKPINELKDKLDDLKIDLGSWWDNTVKSTFEDIRDKIPDIADWWNNTVKSTFEDIQKAIPKWEDIKTGFEKFFGDAADKIVGGITEIPKVILKPIAIWFLWSKTGYEDLEKGYNSLPKFLREDEDVKRFYEEEYRKEKEKGYKNWASPVTSWLGSQIANGVWLITDRALPKIKEWIDEFGEAYNVRKEELEAMKKLAESGEFGLNAVVGFVLGVTLAPTIMAKASPVLRKMEQDSEIAVRSGLLAPHEIIRMWKRGFIKEERMRETLQRQGYTDSDIDAMIKDYQYMPSPSEIISWLAREVFEPDMIKKWRLDEGFEDVKGRELFYQQGIDDDMIKKFWIAHWTHLDYYRIKTLVNRGILKEEDVAEWCKLQEIAPVWADKMWELMWDDLTRVDIRRIYELGYRDDDWLRKQLTRIGYKDENLEDMFEFYKRYKLRKYHGILEDLYVEEFKNDMITPDQFYNLMIEIGYTKDEAEALTYLMMIKKGHQTYGELLNSARKMKKAMGMKGAKEIREEIIKDEKRLRELEAQRDKAIKEKWGAQAIHSLNTTIADLKAKIERAYKEL